MLELLKPQEIHAQSVEIDELRRLWTQRTWIVALVMVLVIAILITSQMAIL